MSASRLRWAIPAAVVPVLLLLAYGFKTDPREIPTPLLGRPAAAFSLTTFSGAPVSLESLRGKVVVLNFWASWCVPACYEEAPTLERTWRDYKDKGVTVVGVDIQDKEEAATRVPRPVRPLLPERSRPQGPGRGGLRRLRRARDLLHRPQGRVRFKHVGALTDEIARRHLDALLKEPS